MIGGVDVVTIHLKNEGGQRIILPARHAVVLTPAWSLLGLPWSKPLTTIHMTLLTESSPTASPSSPSPTTEEKVEKIQLNVYDYEETVEWLQQSWDS